MLSGGAVAGVMAFGAGVLISALSFELVLEAFKKGGGRATVLGFAAGAVIYSIANWLVDKQGAKNRKRSGDQQASDSDAGGRGLAESVAIGTVVAIFISNLPEGLSSAVGMKKVWPPWPAIRYSRTSPPKRKPPRPPWLRARSWRC